MTPSIGWGSVWFVFPALSGGSSNRQWRIPKRDRLRIKMLSFMPRRLLIAGGLLLSFLACPLHAGINSVTNGDFQALPPASPAAGDRPPKPKTQPAPAVPATCSPCQTTLNEQEVSCILWEGVAEPVVGDACLHAASQALSQETPGIGKATRKRTRPGQAAPEPKRRKSQAGKRKQAAILKASLRPKEPGWTPWNPL